MAFGTYDVDLPTLPSPASRDFLSWPSLAAEARITQALTLEPDATYYFSNELGSPGNDGQSEGSPLMMNQSNINILIAFTLATSQAFEFKFRRGETFDLSIEWAASVEGGYRITDWGDPEDDLPVLSNWVTTGYAASDNAWTHDSGNVYTTTPTREIGWISEVDNRFNPYMYVLSAARCAVVPHSWHQETIDKTFTAATDDIISCAGHGLSVGDVIRVSTTGALPGGMVTERTYFVISNSFTTDQFKVSETSGGSALNITSTGSGTHTLHIPSTLYLNAGGEDPNDTDYQVIPDRNSLLGGIHVLSGTGTGTSSYYVKNIHVTGFGASPSNSGTNAVYSIRSSAGNRNIMAVENCHGDYAGRHIFGMTASAGIFVTKNCSSAYGSIDCTDWVTFGAADEPEGIHIGMTYRFGKLPSENYTTVATGPVVYSGEADSGAGQRFYAHTGGGAETMGIIVGWGATYEDNRATYPRCTVPSPGGTANNLPGSASDLESLRAFLNFNPVNRLVMHPDVTVTADATNDTLTATDHGFQNGDCVRITSDGTIPGGITNANWYLVCERTDDTFKLLPTVQTVSAVDLTNNWLQISTNTTMNSDSLVMLFARSTGKVPAPFVEGQRYYSVINSATFTTDFASDNDTFNSVGHGFVEGERVKLTNSGGALPTGVNINPDYYIRNPTADTFQLSTTATGSVVTISSDGTGTHTVKDSITIRLSETLGGSAIDITDEGYGEIRFCYNVNSSTPLNITSTGSGTHTARCIDVESSSWCQTSSWAGDMVYINCKQRGLQKGTVGGGSTPTFINYMQEVANVSNTTFSSACFPGDDDTHYYTHLINLGISGNAVHSQFSAPTAAMFNCIIDQQDNGAMTNLATNDTDHLRGTGYFDTYGSFDAAVSNDDYKQNITTSTSLGMAIQPTHAFYKAGFPTPNGIDIEYDFNGKRRDIAAPNIGPIDANGEGGYRHVGNAPLVIKKGRLGNR